MRKHSANCGICGESVKVGEACICKGSTYCTCEFYWHHRGCCESFEELVEHIASDHKLDLEADPWAPISYAPMEVFDAHDEYRKVSA